jgi:hypothetical protein
MALQPLNFGKTPNNSPFIPGLLAGGITLCCGLTASFLSPSSQVIAALAGSTLGATGVTIIRKQQDQKLKHLLTNQLKSHVSSTNSDIAALTSQINQSKTEAKAANKVDDSCLSNQINFQPIDASNKVADTPSKNAADLIAVLQTHNIKIEGYKESLPIDEILDKIAVTIGEKYPILEPLHHQIIRSLQTGKKFSFSLANSSQAIINTCTQFCQNLHSKSLLESYYYDKRQKVIYATPQLGNHEISYFLSGGWFERFVYHQVASFLDAQEIKYQSLRNAHISLKNQDKLELDLLFLVNQKLIWIECKAGQQSSSYLKSYSRRRKALFIPKEKALLVSLKLSDAQTESWTKLWDITVANGNNFLESISQALSGDRTVD